MNLLALRDRIRTKAIANSLTYTEIETLFDVNELLNQTMPCLAWKYSGETNDFTEVGTEMSLNIYLLTNFPDSVKTETEDYQRDYIITQQDLLRTYFYTWLQAMPFESGSDFLEVLTTDEIPIAERLSINAFLTMEFRVNISIKRDFCVDAEEIAPTSEEVKVYFNSVLKYTQASKVDLLLTLKNQDGDDITATFTGYDIVVTQPVPVGATLTKTGQTTSYRTGDDGDLQEGRATDFLTLGYNNPFGNTNRFTDELGGTTYANNIVIDWSTYNGSEVLGYYRVSSIGSWSDAITNSIALSVGTFTIGWRLPNIKELLNICKYEGTALGYPLNYPPFNLSSGTFFWSSTTNQSTISTAQAVTNNTTAGVSSTTKTLTFPRIIQCRTFTVSGTTLT
jgi:hypothetical protein